MKRTMGVLHEGLSTFTIISSLILLGMENISDKSSRKRQNIHFIFSSFFTENCAFYVEMWKSILEQTGYKWRYGARALHSGYLRLHTHTHKTHTQHTHTQHTHTHNTHTQHTESGNEIFMISTGTVITSMHLSLASIHTLPLFI
jgi:hypothetical protein